MNEENDCNQMTDADVKKPIQRVTHVEKKN